MSRLKAYKKAYSIGQRIGGAVGRFRGAEKSYALGYRKGRGKVAEVKKVLEGNKAKPRGGVGKHLWRNKGKYGAVAGVLFGASALYGRGVRRGFLIANYDPGTKARLEDLTGDLNK